MGHSIDWQEVRKAEGLGTVVELPEVEEEGGSPPQQRDEKGTEGKRELFSLHRKISRSIKPQRSKGLEKRTGSGWFKSSFKHMSLSTDSLSEISFHSKKKKAPNAMLLPTF